MQRAMQSGDVIRIRAKKSDGTTYRTWHATVESVEPDRLATINRVGDRVGGPAGGWAMKHATRTVFWFTRPYNLAEVYQPDGALKQIYIHIASPAAIERDALVYTDCELDVVKPRGKTPRVVDEDEFDAASTEYGYSAEFRSSCRGAVSEALAVAASWQAMGAPAAVAAPSGGRRPGRPRRARVRRRKDHLPRLHHEARTDTPATDSRIRSTEV